MFWGKGRRRRKLLQEHLDPEAAHRLLALAPLLATAPPRVLDRLQGVALVLLAEKSFEGCGGLELTGDMALTIAAQAALLQLHQHADYYPGLDSVLVYPEAFVVDHPVEDDDGFVTEGEDELAGESWQRGAVILSWSDVGAETADPGGGYNVVLHEFAHQLDDQTGEADGTPLLAGADLAARWAEAFGPALDRHRTALRRRREILFDADAAESPAEFFATAVELFFSLPRDLAAEFPAVYAVLAEHFQLDPRSWPAAG